MIDFLKAEDSDLNIDDFTLIKSDEEMEQERRLLAEFALGANLAHSLAYKNNPELSTFSIKEEDKITREYQTIHLKSGHQAIQAEMYLPVKDNDQSVVYVNFTGTCDLATLHADLERNAGERAFHRNKRHLMAQIADAVRQVEARTHKPVTLHFSGHSLGGALAQHGMNETLRYLATNLQEKTDSEEIKAQIVNAEETLKNEIEKHNSLTDNTLSKEALAEFKKVNTVKLSIWDSTGVSKEVQNYSNEVSNLLVQHNHSIHARFGMIGGDFVQQTGEGTVLSDSDADVKVLKLDLGYEGFRSNLLKSFLAGGVCVTAGLALGPVAASVFGTIGLLTRAALPTVQAHISPAHCFNKEHQLRNSKDEGILYEKLHNESERGRAYIKTRLQQKSTLLQTAPLQVAKRGLHTLGESCSRIGIPKAASSVVTGLTSAVQFLNPFKIKR